jgi:predicted restriction endonuclease
MSDKEQLQKWRRQFYETVLMRDGGRCVFCGSTDELDAHHITDRHEMPNGGYVKENGITLCDKHHAMAEKYHATGGKEWHQNMRPDDLYEVIGSSKALAIQKSMELSEPKKKEIFQKILTKVEG